MRKIAYIFVWLFCASIPMQELAASTLVDVSGTIARLLGVAAAIVGLAALIYDGRMRPFAPVHGVIVIYLAWGCLTYLWSADQTLSYARILTNLQLLVMVLLLVQFASRADETLGLVFAYVFGGAISLTELFSRLATGQAAASTLLYERFTAYDNNPNDYALALAIAIPMAWYLATRKVSIYATLLGYGYTALGFFGVVLTSSRGGLLAAGMGAMIIPFSMFRVGRRERVAAIAVVVVGTLIAFKMAPDDVMARLGTIEKVAEEVPTSEMEGRNIRTVIWAQGLAEFATNPKVAAIGVGAGAYKSGVDALYGDEFVAHNVYISILVEQGLVGFVLFIAIALMLVSSLKYLPPMERYLWVFVFLSWAVGVTFVSWEHTKNTWFIIGLLAARAADGRTNSAPTEGFVSSLFRRTRLGLRLRQSGY